MGNNLQPGASRTYSHPYFGNVLVCDQQPKSMLLELEGVPSKEQTQWRAALDSLKTLDARNLLVPARIGSDSQGLCSNMVKLQLEYPLYGLSLEGEIQLRKGGSSHYSENEMLFILHCLVRSASLFEPSPGLGCICSKNVLLNHNGHFKLISRHTAPHVQNNFTKAIASQPSLLAPEELAALQSKKLNQQFDQSLCDSFAIGLVMLEATTLNPSVELIDLPRCAIRHQLLRHRIQSLGRTYSSTLTKLVESLLKLEPQSRAMPGEVRAFLSPYEQSIQSLSDFQFSYDRVFDSLLLYKLKKESTDCKRKELSSSISQACNFTRKVFSLPHRVDLAEPIRLNQRRATLQLRPESRVQTGTQDPAKKIIGFISPIGHSQQPPVSPLRFAPAQSIALAVKQPTSFVPKINQKPQQRFNQIKTLTFGPLQSAPQFTPQPILQPTTSPQFGSLPPQPIPPQFLPPPTQYTSTTPPIHQPFPSHSPTSSISAPRTSYPTLTPSAPTLAKVQPLQSAQPSGYPLSQIKPTELNMLSKPSSTPAQSPQPPTIDTRNPNLFPNVARTLTVYPGFNGIGSQELPTPKKTFFRLGPHSQQYANQAESSWQTAMPTSSPQPKQPQNPGLSILSLPAKGEQKIGEPSATSAPSLVRPVLSKIESEQPKPKIQAPKPDP